MATFTEARGIVCPLCSAVVGSLCTSIAKQSRGRELSTLHNERLRESDRIKYDNWLASAAEAYKHNPIKSRARALQDALILKFGLLGPQRDAWLDQYFDAERYDAWLDLLAT